MALVAGVDSSTSACKVEVRDAETGALIASGRAEHPLTVPPRSEQHPRDWLSAFEQAGAQAGVLDRNRPGAISVAAQQHGLVVTDSRNRPLRPGKLWNDTESAPDSAALIEALGLEGWVAACGSIPVASFTISKLRWLWRNEPDVFARVERVMLPHDWLTAELTGCFTTDRGDASGTGWWSPSEDRYRFDVLGLIDPTAGWEQMVPEVLGPEGEAGEWRTGNAVVAAGTGDNMAAALGLGLRPGDLAISLGTSGTAFCVADRPAFDPTGTVAGFADATGRFLPLVCTLNATKVTDAVARLMGVSAEQLSELALACEAGSGGLVLVPYFDGERTPDRPDAKGSLHGIRSDVTREQLARAAFEGVLCGLLDGADCLGPWVPSTGVDRILLIGGGARSRAYRHVLADLTGRTVWAVTDEELVARGAAIQAAAVLLSTTVRDIANEWPPVASVPVDPSAGVDGAQVRAAYTAARPA
jgi:xylulokinase